MRMPQKSIKFACVRLIWLESQPFTCMAHMRLIILKGALCASTVAADNNDPIYESYTTVSM